MAINPLSFPMPQAFSGGADFSQLANLGNVYNQAQDRATRLQALGQLGTDPTQNAMLLIKSKDPQLAQQGIELMQNITRQKYLESTQTENVREFNEQQKLKEAEFAAKGPDDPEDREALWAKRHPGKDVNSPQAQAYIWKEPKLLQQDPELAKRGLTPYFGVRKNPQTGEEETVPMQMGQTGFTEAPVPPGVSFRNKPIVVTGPTGDTLLDPITRQPIGFVPKDVAGAEKQKVQGEAVGKAEFALPDVLRSTDDIINNIDALQNHPGKKFALGRGSYIPDWAAAGTSLAGFRTRVAQLNGQAMNQNMQLLRGAGLGSVSDFEQRNLQNAFVRASQAQTPEDFDAAMRDARKSAERIRQIARDRASGRLGEQPGEAPAAPKQAEKSDPAGIR
jgi:hypothetical protein